MKGRNVFWKVEGDGYQKVWSLKDRNGQLRGREGYQKVQMVDVQRRQIVYRRQMIEINEQMCLNDLLYAVQSLQQSSANLWRTRRLKKRPLPPLSVKCPERMLRSIGSEMDRTSARPRNTKLLLMAVREPSSFMTALWMIAKLTLVMRRTSKPPASSLWNVSTGNTALHILSQRHQSNTLELGSR